MDYEELKSGYKFPTVSYSLMPSVVSKYKEAVEAQPAEESFVPPLAIISHAFNSMFESISLPPGSIHAAQEAEFLKPVTIGSRIDCQAQVIQKVSRAKLNMLVIEFNAFDSDKQLVLSGKTTLISPI